MEKEDQNEINDAKYKEIKINKMIINGKEQEGNIISAEDTKDKQELNVTVYTQSIKTAEKKGGRHSWIHELLQKGLFHDKRS
ncbi:hypothetical protein [Clostridium sp. Marseille-P2415]|uniref:hypothetical protein n=1 Tax=Clostridium sp. Marseille-P2415 TaxID=1805471 RepID=UPI0009884635|nr:hypothetical protein [Clostridium sp. Marseille-P2415]